MLVRTGIVLFLAGGPAAILFSKKKKTELMQLDLVAHPMLGANKPDPATRLHILFLQSLTEL